MSWWAVGTLVVTTAAKVTQDQKVARRQDRQLAQQIQTQSAHQQDADKAVSDLISKTAASNDQGARQSLLGDFMQQVQDAKGNATGGLNQVGNVSDAYKASGADAALGITDYGKRVADLTSRIDAPGLQRQNEQTDRLRFTSDLGGISRAAAGDDFLAQMRLRNIRANPWLSAGIQAGQAYAGSRLANGYGSTYTPNNGSVAFDQGYGTNLPFG